MDSAIHARRRAALRERMGEGAIAIVPGAREWVRNGDSEFPFRQASDLAYLTGFPEPDAVAVISTARPEHDFVLFVRPRDPARETWSGRRAGVEGAVERYGARAAFPIEELEKELVKLLADVPTLFYRLAEDTELDQRLIGLLGGMRRRARLKNLPPSRIDDLGPLLHEQRLFKAPEEIAALERAAHVTAEAHRACMREARPGLREYELQATLEHHYRKAGGAAGYQPIVARGDNATILHYHENDALLGAGELVLIDSGAEIDLYTADVTRTFPVAGRFSLEQRELYTLVLEAQRLALSLCKPGANIPAIHKATSERLTAGLVELGWLQGDPAAIVEKGDHKRFYMHGTSHWLGLDVHDAGRYDDGKGGPRPLEPGMVLTVEPGLYVPRDASDVPERFRGLGIRIEDDVLITAEGHRNLTAAIPTDIAAIEALTCP